MHLIIFIENVLNMTNIELKAFKKVVSIVFNTFKKLIFLKKIYIKYKILI